MKNVSANINCYGCGVCVIACPTKAIKMQYNVDGFASPHVDNNVCINCGLCVASCSFSNEGLISDALELHSYAGWSRDSEVRMLSSSGGVVHEILLHLLMSGYKVCSVRYNATKHIAEHCIVDSIEGLKDLRGSKYIQSQTVEGLSLIDYSSKYVVVGTPCMVDSLKRLVLKKKVLNNFVFVDFFCHGVPSYFLWDKYVRIMEKKCGVISEVSFRYKMDGWQDSLKLHIKGEHMEYKGGIKQKEIFYRLFLGDYCLGKACYQNCKFKMECSSADIRVGDLWGKSYAHNLEGVSAVVALNKKGDDILHRLEGMHLQEESFDVISEGQMKMSPPEPWIRKLIISTLVTNKDNFKKELFLINCSELLKKVKKIITEPHIVVKNRLNSR